MFNIAVVAIGAVFTLMCRKAIRYSEQQGLVTKWGMEMTKDKNLRAIGVSFLLVIIMLILSSLGECAFYPILIMQAVFVLIAVIAGLVTVSVKRLRQWQVPIATATLIYIGFSFMILAQFKTLLSKLSWDSSMLGLGVAVVAFGFAIYSQTSIRRIENKLKELAPQPGDTVDLPTEPAAKAKLLEQLIMAPTPAEAKAVSDITGRITITSRSKEETQKRLDEDTKKVGYQRGELYQLEDGSWVIHWGGKYPL